MMINGRMDDTGGWTSNGENDEVYRDSEDNDGM